MSASPQDEELRALARRLKVAREFLNLSQQFVADETGIPRGSISDIERGARRVDSLELKRLATLYRLTSEYLLTGADPSEEDGPTFKALARATKQMTESEQAEVLRFAMFLRNYKRPPSEGAS